MRRSDREIKDKAEFIDILERGDACHLALINGTEPYLVTLNYGFSWDTPLPVLYFHCANAGRKLDIIRINPRACFGVDVDHELVRGDNGCAWGMKYRSIIGRGKMEIVESPVERENGLELLMTHYSGLADFRFDDTVLTATVVLKLTVEEITGKKKA